MRIKLKLFEWYRRNLISLLSIPLILIGCIYICYGDVFDSVLLNNTGTSKIYQLYTHVLNFKSDLPLPISVKSIGYYSIQFIYMLFSGWLISFLYSLYTRLSHRTGSMVDMLIELLLILFIYWFSISPGMNLWLDILIFLSITLGFILLFFYLLYEIQNR
jgi:hypothetical protein